LVKRFKQIIMIKKLTCLFFFAIVSLSAETGFAFSIKSVESSTPKNFDFLRGDVFVKMSAKDFAKATGTRLNFFQRIYFRIIKHRVKHDLKQNPNLLITDYYDADSGTFKFNLLWFVIGSVIGPLGVLLAYYSHQQKNGPDKKDRTTSAWIGCAFFVLWFGYIFIF